jgi:glycerol-3-phosphate dehydrogenase (NAD(P)+)
MARILILGAGVMGSALAVPAADNGNEVLLVGTPLDREIVSVLQLPGGIHPKLDAPLPASVRPMDFDALRPEHVGDVDFIVVGVSSPGIEWAVGQLNRLMTTPRPIAFVTKGLVGDGGGLRTYAQSLPPAIPNMSDFIGIGGPCIARELANRLPTDCVYACSDVAVAERFAAAMRTHYYRLSVTGDVTGVEACAALKNFFAIGVSAMQTRFPDMFRNNAATKNATAAAFNQASREMAVLCARLGGHRDTAFDLAGIGDLHVTVGGGRNSRLGHGLGQGRRASQIMAEELAGETVEGIDTARALSMWCDGRISGADLPPSEFPVALSIIRAILDDTSLSGQGA